MVKETRFALGYSLKLFRSHSTILKRTVGTGDRSSLIFIFSPRIIDYDIIVGGRKEKKKKKWKDDYSKFSFASWNISSHLDVEWVPRREPCLLRKSLVSQSNRTQNHGAESRLTARRRENTLCYRRKGLFENVWRKLEEETVTRVGSSNFSTSSHWNTENTYPPLSFALHVDHSTAQNGPISLSLSSSLFVLLPSPPSFPSLSHLKHLFLYIYFNSVIEDIKHTYR